MPVVASSPLCSSGSGSGSGTGVTSPLPSAPPLCSSLEPTGGDIDPSPAGTGLRVPAAGVADPNI